MTLRIYNSLERKKVDFVPLEEGKVKMYVCGPTVYDKAHLGHGRSSVAFDVMRKYLIYKGFEVTYVSNYTDIDDKMITRAREEGITVPQLAEKVIPFYARDYGKLGVMVPDIQPKATEYVVEMIELVARLEKGGFTYVIEGDGVYFDVMRFERYGELSGNSLEDLQAGSRVAVADGKRNAQDFVLWKFRKEGEEDFWGAPWGEGRPGWHIECSAMTWKCLGEKFDIHGGGLDLTFPHHECEIAQSCGVFGEGSFAQYWLHNGFINVDNEKMSKSLGNFFTLEEIFEKYDPVVVRFMLIQTHYRNPVNFSDSLLEQARAGLLALRKKIKELKNEGEKERRRESVEAFLQEFERCMDDDFNLSGALAAVNGFLNDCDGSDEAISALRKVDSILGVMFVPMEEVELDANFVAKVEALVAERDAARAARNFGKSDEIRDRLKEMGVEVEDSAEGTKWRKR